MLVFNTCTIREKPDTRLAAHLGNARVLKERNPDAIVAVGGCYAEAQRDRLFELYPFVDVAFGPGTIPHLADWIGANGEGVRRGAFGIAAERTFSAGLPMHRERPFQAWVQVSMGCNSKCAYCIVPAVRGREVSRRPGEIVAEVTRLATEGVREITLLGQNVNSWGRDLSASGTAHRLRRAPARLRRRRRDRAHPLHEPAPQGLPRPGDRRARRVRGGLRARAPAAPVGLVADPQGHAPHVRPRPLRPPRRAAARRGARPRPRHRHHRRLPRRDRGGLPADARGRRGGALRQRVHVRLLAAPRDRGRRPARPGAGRGRSASASSGSSRSSSASPPSATPSASAASRRCSSRARAAPIRRSCAAARAATRPSTSPATRAPGDLVDVEITSSTSTTLGGRQAALVAA